MMQMAEYATSVESNLIHRNSTSSLIPPSQLEAFLSLNPYSATQLLKLRLVEQTECESNQFKLWRSTIHY